jgi:hypothetical protein
MSAAKSPWPIATAMSRGGVKTASGAVELQRPRIRNAEAPGFESLVLGKGVTHALDSLVVCSFLCGLSVRDVEAALEETFEEQIVFRAPCHGSERTAASATRRGAGVGWSSTWAARASTTASHSLRSCSCC